MTTDVNERIYRLVKEEFEKMNFSKTKSNRAILSNKCQEIVYNEWGFSNQNILDIINKCVDDFILEEMD